MIVKFTDNFLMIRGLITVLSALKMRNFTWIFPKKFRPPLAPPPGKGGFAPPYENSQLRPCKRHTFYITEALIESRRKFLLLHSHSSIVIEDKDNLIVATDLRGVNPTWRNQLVPAPDDWTDQVFPPPYIWYRI